MVGTNNLGISIAASEQPLFLVYPANNHQTTADKIFLIGTAAPDGQVLVNGKAITRNQYGHFAPNFPLKLGENLFTVRYQNQEIQIRVTRLSQEPVIPVGVAAFAPDSLTPNQDIARLPGELICFGAIAAPNATVSVQLAQQTIPLLPQSPTAQLPPNSAVLTASNQPIIFSVGNYQGCTTFSQVGNLGNPRFQLSLNQQTITQESPVKITILSPAQLDVIEVIANVGVTRTGASTDYSRLTPLPQGTRATVTGKEGDWLRLDYGAWIKRQETKFLPGNIAPTSIIRGISSRQVEGATEVTFPLQVPVPFSIEQGDKKLRLTLYNTTAQTDTISLGNSPIIQRLDWQQIHPNQVQYTFFLKPEQQWGYDYRYQGTSLILSLRHPPQLTSSNPLSLKGTTILLDPGHGGQETGTRGPTGYSEKEINLVIAKRLQRELISRGATVYLTRETDKELSLQERVDMINQLKPTIALSIHYNALPDGGDAIKTSGLGAFWYHPQAEDLAIFLHDYLVKNLHRRSYGVFWNNLALTRPHTTPSVLLEMGFMINPDEFTWIIDLQEQDKLVKTLANGITEWLQKVQS